MSILIRGLAMPKSYKDIRIYADGRIVSKSLYMYGEEIATAVPVPPHGRLGDLDELLKKCEFVCTDDDVDVRAVRYSVIDAAPTIIPAEEGE